MSEEVLKALTQLFAIITKQDGGVTARERLYVIHFFQTELDQDSVDEYVALYDSYSGYGADDSRARRTSVSDSVKTLVICKKINKTLTKKQKVVVLIKLLELVGPALAESPQRREIINTVSSVFNLEEAAYHALVKFVIGDDPRFLDLPDILIADAEHESSCKHAKHIHAHFSGFLFFLHVPAVDMYFVKYEGSESNVLNGFIMEPHRIYLFTHGSTIKSQAGDAIYYSDIVAKFNDEIQTTRLSFNANLGEVVFASGTFGLRGFRISEGPGKLIGIMGASGAGKTTLLNVLSGVLTPTKGEVRINGIDLYRDPEKLRGVIGYVSQDDLLIEELTVYQNLYFNARLCFANLSEEELDQRVMAVLRNLGLDQRKDLKVGSALEKVISGGQRKRLNIALELIREPAVLFLDEPTSGLSSRDSETVIDLLKELSLKGKLIFVVIHQPSSDIYKMFDKMIIMDTGGYPAYYGPPVDAITYFKKASHQVDSSRGHCHTCGNVNPEQIFSILDARVVDEYGQPTARRKMKPWQWYEQFSETFQLNRVPDVHEQPPGTLDLPSKFKQAIIFATRDMLAKVSNKQYMLINLLEAPLLAFLLAFIVRYNSSPEGEGYVFRFNDNFPAFLLMSIIVALFMGLSVSAEEIIRDRKILKRESFLHLSWNSYLVSKLMILFSLSAIQTLTFVLVSHALIEIEWKMLLPFWFVLFATSCMANVLGLNISSAFRSAVTVYILIPLLLIPQMILSGVMFPFDKINETIGGKGNVPFVADLMASRWAYEAMAVFHFKNNSYEAPLYEFDKRASEANFKNVYLAEELMKRFKFVADYRDSDNDAVNHHLRVIRESLRHEPYRVGLTEIDPNVEWKLASFSPSAKGEMEEYLKGYKKHYQDIYNASIAAREAWLSKMENNPDFSITEAKNRYYNESLADLLMNVSEEKRIVEHDGRLIQQIDPVFQDPRPRHIFDYRAHFFAPSKNLLGAMVSTYWFNTMVIWVMTAIFYLALYAKIPMKSVEVLTYFSRRNRRGNLAVR
jgi:ABC-type multidrug transport system ATPase subunit